MASFSKAFEYLMENEGGYSDNPADHGGVTNYGITISTYSFFLGHKATAEEMKSIDKNTAMDVYRKFYWVPLCLDMINSDSIATAMFDQAVNRGGPTIVREVQRLCGLTPDGIVGRNTLDAINETDPKGLISDIALCAEAYYKMLAQRDKTQAMFLPGWMNRVEKLKELS